MTINTIPTDIPFGGGVDEKVKDEKLGPGQFEQLLNLRMVKRGSYQKRLGHTILSSSLFSGTSLTTGTRVIGVNDELLQLDSTNASGYVFSETAQAWRKLSGHVPQAAAYEHPIASFASNPTDALSASSVGDYDSCTAGQYYVAAWVTRPPGYSAVWGIRAAVIDSTTMTNVTGVFNVTASLGSGYFQSASQPHLQVVPVGSTVFILFSYDGTYTSNVWVSKIQLDTKAHINSGWSTPGALATTYATAGVTNIFDSTSIGTSGQTKFALAFINASNPAVTASLATVTTFDASLNIVASQNVPTGTVGVGHRPTSLSIDGYTDILWMAYPHNNTTTIKAVGLNPTTLATSVAAGTVMTVDTLPTNLHVARKSATYGYVFSGTPSSKNFYIGYFDGSIGTVVDDGAPFLSYRFMLDIRPFTYNGRWFIGVRNRVYRNSEDKTSYIIDLTSTLEDKASIAGTFYGYLRPVSQPYPRLIEFTGKESASRGARPTTEFAGSWMLPQAVKTNAFGASLAFHELRFNDTNICEAAAFGEGAALSGAAPSYYDGNRISEISFMQRPVVQQPVESGTALGASQALKYIAVYEWIDDFGQLHQSNASDAFSFTATKQIQTVGVTALLVSNKGEMTTGNQFFGPRLALYRTQDIGNVYYRVQYVEVTNDTSLTDGLVSFVDNVFSDSLGATLYIQPGIPNTSQGRQNPPSLSSMIAHGDRLVGFHGKDIWYSFQAVDGEGPSFADLFQFPVESSGNITAIASMDGALIVFKHDRIFFIDGTGPGDNGTGGDFSPPQSIATDLGCIEPRSVIMMPDGIMFQSFRGIELLTRARQLAPFFGNQMEDSLTANPIITSATLDESKGTVTFMAVDAEDALNGVTLCWDYVHQIWTTGLIRQGVGIKSAKMVGSGSISNPTLTCLFGDGVVTQESTTSYQDSDTGWVTSQIVTPWIKPGLVGFQMAIRAILLAQRVTGHDLTISIAYDYSDSYTDSKTWTAAQIVALSTNREELEIAFSQPECTSFRLKITDATPSSGSVGTGQGAIFIGAQFEGGDQEILVPLPEGNRK